MKKILKDTPQKEATTCEVAGYIPLHRFYKWIKWGIVLAAVLVVSVGVMTYGMGVHFGKLECKTDGLQATQKLEHKYNRITNEEYNNLLNADSIDDYLMQ